MMECSTCKYFDTVRILMDRSISKGHNGWGYCDMMQSEFTRTREGELGETNGTLAISVDAAYGRGDRVETMVSPDFVCRMYVHKSSENNWRINAPEIKGGEI